MCNVEWFHKIGSHIIVLSYCSSPYGRKKYSLLMQLIQRRLGGKQESRLGTSSHKAPYIKIGYASFSIFMCLPLILSHSMPYIV